MPMATEKELERARLRRRREWSAELFALPLAFAAVAAMAAAICRFLGAFTAWPAWVVLALAVPCAGVVVSLHIGQMENDLMDIRVGSLQMLVFAAVLFSVCGRVEQARQRKLEKPLPQSQVHQQTPGPRPQAAR